jgi:hypothetical protein
VTRLVFAGRARVEDDDVIAGARPLQQLPHRHGLGVVTMREVFTHQSIEIGKPLFRDRTQAAAQIGNGVVSEPVVHVQTLLAGLDEGGLAQRLQML